MILDVVFCKRLLQTCLIHLLCTVTANLWLFVYLKKVSEYDQEIQQSQTADNPMAPRGRAAQPSRDTRKTNKAKQPAVSSPSR